MTTLATPSGILGKLEIQEGQPARYTLVLGEQRVALNPLLGRQVRLTWAGLIQCTACGRKIRRSFQNGTCFPCFSTRADCDRCILQPQLCHYKNGSCRNDFFAKSHCLRPHFLYLAETSGLKVGVTRQAATPTRWLDQGACQALPILRLGERHAAGLLEREFARLIPDRTQWKTMLQRRVDPGQLLDLPSLRDQLLSRLSEEIRTVTQQFPPGWVEELPQEGTRFFHYPGDLPGAWRSFKPNQDAPIGGRLLGMKGQYLLFDEGVFHVRRFEGHVLHWWSEATDET
jgi:hypothetical protein